jgi:hypothetical protein
MTDSVRSAQVDRRTLLSGALVASFLVATPSLASAMAVGSSPLPAHIRIWLDQSFDTAAARLQVAQVTAAVAETIVTGAGGAGIWVHVHAPVAMGRGGKIL